jgi:hypothetical protein
MALLLVYGCCCKPEANVWLPCRRALCRAPTSPSFEILKLSFHLGLRMGQVRVSCLPPERRGCLSVLSGRLGVVVLGGFFGVFSRQFRPAFLVS